MRFGLGLGHQVFMLFLFLRTVFCLGLVSGAHAEGLGDAILLARQDAGGGGSLNAPMTVQVVKTFSTTMGPMTETCNVTLTPLSSGQFEEISACKFALQPANGVSNSPLPPNPPPPANNPPPPANNPPPPPPPPPATTQADAPLPTTTLIVSPPAPTPSSDPAAASQPPAVVANGASTIPQPSESPIVTPSPPPPPPAPSPDPAPAPSDAQPDPSPPAPPSPVSPSSSSTSTSSSSPGTAVAETSPTASTASFTLPGRKLQVLPIGLGVFAGISVIALIVVGLVTYERTKYRRAFRQRRLAEMGSQMGYGGMA